MKPEAQVIEAIGFDASEVGSAALSPQEEADLDTDYMPGGADAHVLDSEIGREPGVLVLGSEQGHTWPAVKERILQAEAHAVAKHFHKRIVKVTSPDIPGRPDMEQGVYSGFPVHHGETLTLHFNDGDTHEL